MKVELMLNGLQKKLTVESSPEDWVEALYFNAKAMLSNAGQKGGIYPDFNPFSPQEIKSFLGLYVLHGLSPSPQVKMRFKSQLEDPVCGSDICHAVFGKNTEKRHKYFKAFFACQYPMLPTPSKKTHPNHKIDNFLSHVNHVSMEARDVGKHLSCDEQTIGFQGRHQDKQRIRYKKVGDGFQADCICENGNF